MLPAGLTLSNTADNQTCQITGTPTAVTPSMQYTITGRNVTSTDIATVTIVVEIAPPVLVAPSPATAAGMVGVGIEPIIFTNEDGSDIQANGCELTSSGGDATNELLGLVLSVSEDNRNCVLSGTPTAPGGVINYDVIATNAGGPSSAVRVTITVTPQAPVLVAPNPATVTGIVGQAIDPITFTNNGGAVVEDGCTPSSQLVLDVNGLTIGAVDDGGKLTCQIEGIPLKAAEGIEISVTATNAGGTSDPVTVTITINPKAPDLANIAGTRTFAAMVEIDPIIFTNGNGGDVQADAQGCEFTSSSGSSTMLPAGLTLSNTADNQTCQITGTPTTVTPSMQYTITAMNLGGSDTATVTIVVEIAPPVLVAPNPATAAGIVGEEIAAYYLHQRRR